MVFQEPKVMFVELLHSDTIATSGGAGYTLCQRVGTSDVGCNEFYANTTAAEVCYYSCVKNSEAESDEEFNHM